MSLNKNVSYYNVINPAHWVRDATEVLIERELNNLPEFFQGVPMIRGRKRWLTAIPAPVLCATATAADTLSGDTESRYVQSALYQRRLDFLRVFKPTHEATTREGRWFCSALFLEQVGPFFALPATAAALAAFVRAADNGQVKVSKILKPELNDSSASNYKLWQPWEDAVLRAWFGVRTVGPYEGKHAPLTEREWDLVLREHLKGRRTKQHVKTRISILNKKLRVSLLVDGFLPRENVTKYQANALGEYRIRVPRYRPRIKGRSYLGDNERVVIGQPE